MASPSSRTGSRPSSYWASQWLVRVLHSTAHNKLTYSESHQLAMPDTPLIMARTRTTQEPSTAQARATQRWRYLYTSARPGPPRVPRSRTARSAALRRSCVGNSMRPAMAARSRRDARSTRWACAPRRDPAAASSAASRTTRCCTHHVRAVEPRSADALPRPASPAGPRPRARPWPGAPITSVLVGTWSESELHDRYTPTEAQERMCASNT